MYTISLAYHHNNKGGLHMGSRMAKGLVHLFLPIAQKIIYSGSLQTTSP